MKKLLSNFDEKRWLPAMDTGAYISSRKKVKSRLFIRDCDVPLEKKWKQTDYNIVKIMRF